MNKLVYVLMMVVCAVSYSPHLDNSSDSVISDMVRHTVMVRCMSDGVKVGHGSGVILDPDKGEILTNYHVAKNFELQIIDYLGNCHVPIKVHGSKKYDLAMILVDPESLPRGLEKIDFAMPDIGDFVYAVGTPFDEQLNFSLTFGIVSGFRDIYQLSKGTHIQHDAAINGGNSGGPLFDVVGNLVGINQATFGSHYMGISLAISADTVREFYDGYWEVDTSWPGKEILQLIEDWLDG